MGKVNQSLDQFRRQLIKLSVPVQYTKLADRQDDSAECLFSDSITESLKALQKETDVKVFLKDSKYIQPKLHRKENMIQQTAGSQTSQKRTCNQGPKQSPFQQPKNNRYSTHTYIKGRGT